MCLVTSFFFFFKQKTAYEMRISDWSSDVCSSDLPDGLEHDVYDERATHCLLFHKRTESWAGTARLILPNAEDPNHTFPLPEFCNDPAIYDPQPFPVFHMGETSRLRISKDFPRLQGHGLFPSDPHPESPSPPP